MLNEEKKSGYPSINKPWLKYYSEEAIKTSVPECSIYDYIWESNRTHLEDVALNYFGKKVTYKNLFENIRKVACAFTEMGVKEGDIVTLLLTNVPETIYVIYALNLLGAISNLEYVTLSDRDIVQNINTVKSEIIVVLDVLLEKFSDCLGDKKVVVVSSGASLPPVKKWLYESKKSKKYLKTNFISLEELIIKNSNVSYFKAEYKNDRTAVMVHSGGTTGTPKSVELTNLNLNAIAFQYKHFGADFKRRDIFMHAIPPFHAFGLSVGIHMPLSLGFTIYMREI